MHVERFPRYLDEVSLATWCSGVGSRWAERRYSVVAAGQETAGGGVINASTLWVHVDMATMRPIPVPESFAAQFAEAAGGRTVSARLHLPTKPPTAAAGADVAQAHFHPWPVRFVDLDVLGHVNNSVYWAMVEDQLAQRVDLVEPFTITLEHHDAIDADDEVLLTVLDSELGFDMWITTGDPGAPAESRRAAAVVRLDGQIQNDTGT